MQFFSWLAPVFFPTTLYPRGEKTFGCYGNQTQVSKHHKPPFIALHHGILANGYSLSITSPPL